MGAFSRNAVLFIFLWLMMAGVCLGRQVYLKDGGTIDCQSFWQRGDQVFVKINRDVVVDFKKSEIDARRTFRHAGRKPHHAGRTKIRGDAKPATAPMPAAAVAPGPATAPASAAAPPPAVAAKALPPPAPAPLPAAGETAQPEPPQPVAADTPAPPDKEDLANKRKQAAEMMADAIRRNDPELMKQAIEMQKNAGPVNGVQAAGIMRKAMLLSLVISLLIIASVWVIFEKAGDSGWKSLVPIYNGYTLMEVSGCPGWWVLLLFIPFVNVVFFLLAMISLAGKFRRGALFGVGLWLLPMFFFPVLAFGGSQYEG